MEKPKDNTKITITIRQAGGTNTIETEDNGGGIPSDVMPKIFDPYFSTQYEKNGVGLGLYMSKTIIEEHMNGLLTAKNTSNGVCFTMELFDDE